MSRIVHFEIPSSEPEKTISFFGNIFGWTFTRWGEEEYWLANTGSDSSPGINGAIIKKRAPDMPLVNTIKVDNIDETIEAVEKNGGTIVVQKSTVPGIGYLCYFKDPDGMIHGLMQNDPAAK